MPVDDPSTRARPEDAGAGVRAKPFRLIQIIFVIDAVLGMGLHALAPSLGGTAQVFDMPVLEFVGLALMIIGASGYILFEILARAAMRRTNPPPALR